MNLRFPITLAALLFYCLTTTAWQAKSPNSLLTMDPKDEHYIICYRQQPVLEIETVVPAVYEDLSSPQHVTADYQMLTGKRLRCINEANEYRLGAIVWRLYNNGIAFRYEGNVKEQTTYLIPEGTKRWMQQWTEAYEGFFPLTISYKTAPIPSFSGVSTSEEGWNNRWGFPALLEPHDGVFVLLSEANIEKGQSGACLYNDGTRFHVVADKCQDRQTASHSPWRVAIIGTLADIVESTLVTDVSDANKLGDTSWIQPGVVSWVYWAYNQGSKDYDIIKKYVDMAVVLHLPYVLIDAEWDEMDKVPSNEGKTIEDAVGYARSKGVKPLIWYNSSVGWVDGAPGPKYRLNKPEDREREFAWCEKIGVAGVKIDFFSGENQMNMDYCIDLLESAARHHLLVNFHGATIPRGWQRTYPNLLSTEGVYGAEWYNNVPTFTNQAAHHNATLPFTRNIIGPMDYTPCAFSDSQRPHITSNAHELALTVLYESGLQHLADRPESFLAQPIEVQQFLSKLPAVWDETRFISGYPGESCVLARCSGDIWYIAGINGTDEKKVLEFNTGKLKFQGEATLFLDEENVSWDIRTAVDAAQLPKAIACQPCGGFVIVVR